MEVQPEDCLVSEDWPAGGNAAMAAEMNVVAVSTSLTRQYLHGSGLLPPEQLVDNPKLLPTVVAHDITHHQRNKTKR
jgi:beta-phosphoglucomutase-like phosphatase (HAD superfamily)